MYHLNKPIIHTLIWASALMTKSETKHCISLREALGSCPRSLPYQAPQQLKPQKQKSHLTCVDPSERPPGAEVRTPNHCWHDFLVILLTHEPKKQSSKCLLELRCSCFQEWHFVYKSIQLTVGCFIIVWFRASLLNDTIIPLRADCLSWSLCIWLLVHGQWKSTCWKHGFTDARVLNL